MVHDSSVVHVVPLRCHTLCNTLLTPIENYSAEGERGRFKQSTDLKKASFQGLSFLHFCHPGKKRRLKHSSHSTAFRFGKVASYSMNDGLARTRISIQFCLGTVERTLKCCKAGSYTLVLRFLRMGFLHGFNEGSEATV